MFLLGYKKNKNHRLATQTDNNTKQTADIEIIPAEDFRKIENFLTDLSTLVDPHRRVDFFAQQFQVKTTEYSTTLLIGGSMQVDRYSGGVEIEIPFTKRDLSLWERDTEEELRQYHEAEKINTLLENYETLSEFVEQNYVRWTGLKAQLPLFGEGVQVTFASAN